MLGGGKADVSARWIARRIAAPALVVLALCLPASPAAGIFGNPTTISGDGVPASAPQIAVDSNDNALAVWTEDDGGVERVRAAFKPAGGDVQTLPFLSAGSGKAFRPLVVFDEHDNALVVWTWYESTEDGVPGHVQAAFRPAGGTFGAAETISGSDPGADHYQPRVAIDESAAVVWTRADQSSLSVQAAFRPKDGSFGAPQTISTTDADEPDVAVDERGNSHAVWTGYPDGVPTVMSAFRPRTGAWSAPTRISDAGHHAFGPRVAVDGRNNAVATWVADADGTSDQDPNFIEAATRPEGGSFGAGTTVSEESGAAFEPQVVFDERDNVLLAWSRTVDGVSRVETASRAEGATLFGAPQTVSPAGVDAYEPRLAVDESAALVWTEAPGPDLTRVQGAFKPKGGAFGAPQALAEPGDSSFEPAVAVDRSGNALALWTRNELPGLPVVQFAVRQRTGSFSEPDTLSASGAGAFEPYVVTDRLSNTLAVWTVDSNVNDDTNPTTVEAAFAPAGGRFGAPVRLSDPGRTAYQPRVAFENDGDATVVWTGEAADGSLRIHARFRPAGNGFGPAHAISPAGAFDPQVSAGRGTAVVWSLDDGANVSAQAAVKPENSSFLPGQTISAAGESANGPQVAVGRDGTAVATWYAAFGDYVAAAIGATASADFGAAATLSPPGMAASEPHVAVDDGGDALVVWTAGSGAFIQAAYRPRGAGFGAVEELASDGVFEPQVAYDESGNAIAAWTRYVNDIGRIETAFRPRGETFGPAAVISGTGEELTNFTPRLAADDAAAVVWTAQPANGGFLRVQSAFRPKDGAFGPVQTLTERLLFAFEPEVAVDERGNVRTVWTVADQIDVPGPSAIQSAFRPRI
jgi:hypothetical protein